ncbi:MAG: response regulator [Rhizobiaceae bacterium]|nr:response regulator [Rhizobiaceae bacterium]
MTNKDFDFLAHDGEAAHLIAAFDWYSTSLGAASAWPQSLKSTIALILQSPVPIVTLWGWDGIMIYNDAYSIFAGGRHPQLLGSKVREGWDEIADFNDNVMRVGLSGRTLQYTDQELTLQRSGTPAPVWMNLDYSPIIDESGKPSGVMAIVVETTAKVRAERRLSGESERLRKLFEQAPGFMALLAGPEHRFEMANESYLKLVGKNREIIGKKFQKALPELRGQGYREHLDGVYSSGEPYAGKSASVKLERNGTLEERFVDFIFQPIIGDNETPIGIFVQGNDVTEQRKAEDSLRAETRLLGILNRLSSDIAAELDIEKVVNRVTEASVALAGAEFGAFFYNVVNDIGECYQLYSLAGAAREQFSHFPMPRNTALFAPTFNGECVVRSDDITLDPRYGRNQPLNGMPTGHLPVRSYLAVPVASRSGEVIGAVLLGHGVPGRFKQEHEDLISGVAAIAAISVDNARLFQALQKELAERRRAELELQDVNANLEDRVLAEIGERTKTEQALRQAQKMEAIGQLTGGVAHDFNNLLQVVSGNLQLLSRDVAGNEKAERRIRNALEGVERGSKLASQLLAFGRRQALEPKVVNIGRFVSGIEDMLRRTIGDGIEIEMIRGGGLWNTLIDPVQIENAVLNLAINARDAMNGSGKLTIEVGNAFLDDQYTRLHDDISAGQYVMLAVSDTGTGMPPEIVSRVFEPFFSTKPVGKGTGLGLSMVYGFVKQSGGHIKIYSEVGEGTTIKLYFPRNRQIEDVLAVNEHGPVTGGSETILVAEDDEQVRTTVVELLGDLGYRVLKAKDAASALTIIESGVPIDLLFTDVVMPGPLKSAELARQARVRMPGLAVLFTSGYTENSIVHGGRLDPGLDLLSKPYSREALARKIRAVLSERKPRQETTMTMSTTAAAPEKARQHILLVEDDALIRMSNAEMLAELDLPVKEAGSAEEALALLAQSEFDILITDLGLPGMSGDAFSRTVRERWPHIAIIFATGRDGVPTLPNMTRTAFVQKPFGLDELRHALDAVR